MIEILEEINKSKGDEKTLILQKNKDNETLRKVLEYTYNNYKQYFVIKVPQINQRSIFCGTEEDNWNKLFDLLDRCDKHEISGNNALNAFVELFSLCSEEQESWMRKVLQRHLNIGINVPRINKVFPNLVAEFSVQLAHKFEEKRIKGKEWVAVEPKLDGFRCISILKDNKCVLYSRNGKDISRNYQHSICKDLEKMMINRSLQPCVLDGELMGKDFKSTTEQVHKKEGANVSDHFYNVFDYIPLQDWINQKITLNCQEAREKLEDLCLPTFCNFVKIVPREIVHPSKIKVYHDLYVQQGFEGVMIKILEDKYKFGRGHNVMKLKEFFDLDLECVSFEEGSGKYSNMLGALIVDNEGTLVNIGSGFSDDQREEIWKNRSKYRGMIVEVRAQEITPDGSLRFPTFRTWRFDKEKLVKET